jgi:hypothetical protein
MVRVIVILAIFKGIDISDNSIIAFTKYEKRKMNNQHIMTIKDRPLTLIRSLLEQ